MSDAPRPQLPCPTCPAEAIAFYDALHIPVTPVKPADKKGRLKGWSAAERRATPLDFKPGDNIGVLNGTLIGDGLYFHDIDIDTNSDRDRRIVERLLPPTGWRYGRPGKPRSHANYLVKGQCRSHKFVDLDGACLLELRGVTQKLTHTLSVGPGSVHTSGEPIRFVEPLTAIGRVDTPEELDTAVRHAAIAIIVTHAWPANNRHKLRLAFAKVLLEYGLPQPRVVALLEAVMEATGSDTSDVADTVSATLAELKAGRPTAGASVIQEILGQSVLTGIAAVLRVSAVDDGKSINVTELTTTMVDRAWTQLVAANEPPGLFARNHEVMILHNCDNTCLGALYEEHLKLEEPTALQHVSGFRKIETDTFREIVGRMIPCVQPSAKAPLAKVYPSREFASLMLASPALPLPEPTGFTSVPFFTAEGQLVTTPGLHRPTGIFYQPAHGFQLPPIPEHPTARDVGMAVATLDAMVWQFPFKGRLGRHPYMDLREGCDWRNTAAFANMMAFPLTVLTRSLFHAVPLFLVDKPQTRTGATLMVQSWCYVLTGAWPSEAEWDGSESERRKFLTAILMTGAPIIFLDEVKDLKSPDLNKILTGKNARIGRVLGSTEITNPHNFSTFVATGNNPAFTKDMAGRMCRVRLDTHTCKPTEREDWEKDLQTWVPTNRVALLQALYVMVRAWFDAGKPQQSRMLNGFEPWSVSIGGILAHAGIGEFLANKRDVEDDAETEEEDEVEALLEAWAVRFPNENVTTPQILQLEGLPSINGNPWTARQLGAWIRRNRDRRRTLGSGQEICIIKLGGEQQWKMKVLSDSLLEAEPVKEEAPF